jgi:hypothetical protein
MTDFRQEIPIMIGDKHGAIASFEWFLDRDIRRESSGTRRKFDILMQQMLPSFFL